MMPASAFLCPRASARVPHLKRLLCSKYHYTLCCTDPWSFCIWQLCWRLSLGGDSINLPTVMQKDNTYLQFEDVCHLWHILECPHCLCLSHDDITCCWVNTQELQSVITSDLCGVLLKLVFPLLCFLTLPGWIPTIWTGWVMQEITFGWEIHH